MDRPRRVPSWGDFTVVEGGWDPEEVRAVIARLLDELASMEGDIERGHADEVARARERVLAQAEHDADETRRRAMESARRTRTLAAEEGREITVRARRDALTIVQNARLDAEEIVADAKEQEAALHERVRHLQAVVGRTESLLRDVAEGDLGELETGSDPAEPRRPDVEIVVAAEQARHERRLQSVPDAPEVALPDSVEKLLNALRQPGSSRDA